MPDQYILAAFQRLELAKPDRTPVLAEIDLVSSHTPWTRSRSWSTGTSVGDGSVFDTQPARPERRRLAATPTRVQTAYGASIEYTLSTLVSFVQHYDDTNLVLVVLGDHQPSTDRQRAAARSHDVPISIIAHDPAVLDQISGWGWQDGLRPDPQAPVWPMDAFRDRFLTAFGATK